MRRIGLLIAAVSLSGCAAGFQGGKKPAEIYTTIPQTDSYVEVDNVRATPWLYGVSGKLAKDTARQRAWDKAKAQGADAIVGLEVEGGCPGAGYLMWMFMAPNCWPKAEGIAIKWVEGHEPNGTE